MVVKALVLLGICAAMHFAPAVAQDQAHPAAPSSDAFPADSDHIEMTAAQLFAYADAARDRGDFATAEQGYRALSHDPDPELRVEARFRLGMMLADGMGKYREAAVEFRAILDEKPDAAGVRLQLARMQAQLGDLAAARKELRAARASGLPPDVDQMVRFYANALESRKPVGASLELAVAPSNNINRATSSDTLGTVIGDFTLDDNAKAKSGIGLSLQGQVYGRLPLARRVDLLARLSASADLYRESEFNDLSANIQIGPQWSWGTDRLALAALAGHSWYGQDRYSRSWGMTGDWTHPTGKRGQLRVGARYLREDNLRNDLQDSSNYTLIAGVDRAFTARTGGGFQLSVLREVARDPGYSTWRGGVDGYVFREFGKTTAVVNFGYNRLEADERLFLYPERRRDDRFSASISGTFRSLRIGTFAPLARLKYEHNKSTIEIYEFERFAAELGVTAAF